LNVGCTHSASRDVTTALVSEYPHAVPWSADLWSARRPARRRWSPTSRRAPDGATRHL